MARLFISLQHEKELSARKRTVTATKGMQKRTVDLKCKKCKVSHL
jgi:hypothetical protein